MPERRRKATAPMQAWCFVGADDVWAISAQEDGANLPAERGPWRPLKAVALEGTDPDERAAEKLIRKQGYCLQPDRKA